MQHSAKLPRYCAKIFLCNKKSDNEPLCPLNTLQNTLVCCTRTTLFLLYIGNWFCQYFSRWHILPRFACFYNLIYFSAYFYTMFCLFFPGFPLISAIFYHFSFSDPNFFMTKYAVFFFHGKNPGTDFTLRSGISLPCISMHHLRSYIPASSYDVMLSLLRT